MAEHSKSMYHNNRMKGKKRNYMIYRLMQKKKKVTNFNTLSCKNIQNIMNRKKLPQHNKNHL